MTRLVSPEEFGKAFLAEAKHYRPQIETTYMYSPEWTDLILGESSGLLAAVSKRLGLQYCSEYFRIDAIMCEKIDADNFRKDDWWAAEQLAVVAEHENNYLGAEKEINKLTIFNSPLKVLITYPSRKGAGRCLATYADVVRRADIFSDFTTHRRHLVILGFPQGDDVRWESYVYQLGKFVPLEATP